MGSFLVGVVVVVAVLGALYWRWKQSIEAEIAEGADIEWAQIERQDPALIEGMSRDKFNAVYRRVHFPRFPGYALATLAAFLISLPVTLALLGGSVFVGQELGLIPAPAELVRYVPIGEARTPDQALQCNTECRLALIQSLSGFYYFFGVLVAWLVIVAVFMRRYHARRPGYLRDEIIRAR